MDRHEHGEHDVRGHGARNCCACGSTRASIRWAISSSTRRRGRATRTGACSTSAAATADPANRAPPSARIRSGSTRWSARFCGSSPISSAHDVERRQRERPVPDSERQSVRLDAGRAEGDLGVRIPQSASAALGDRSADACEHPSARQLDRPAHVGDREHRPQGRELRLLAARRQPGAAARQHDGAAARGGRDSRAHQRHGDRTARSRRPIRSFSTATCPAAATRSAAGSSTRQGDPALRGKYVFTDISTGRIWYADYKEMLAADDGDPRHEVKPHEVGARGRRQVTTRCFPSRHRVPRARRQEREAPGPGPRVGRGTRRRQPRGGRRRRALCLHQKRRHDPRRGRR